MSATTPPKGRPTAGRRDRRLAARRARSRGTTRKFIWVVVALTVLGAVVVLGSGSGGSADVSPGVQTNVVLTGLLTMRLRGLRWGPDPRS